MPEEVKVRHILIKVDPKADAKTDAAAKQKAEDLLKQIKGGADFAALAKANSDDPGSKDAGGELGMIQRGVTVPAFESAAFSLQPGQISDVIKTQFGYHILQGGREADRAPEASGRGEGADPRDLDPPAGGRPTSQLRPAVGHGSRQVRLGQNRGSASPAIGDHRLRAAERGA